MLFTDYLFINTGHHIYRLPVTGHFYRVKVNVQTYVHTLHTFSRASIRFCEGGLLEQATTSPSSCQTQSMSLRRSYLTF